MKAKIEIIVKGHLDSNKINRFEGMTISYVKDNSMLRGIIKDESHLHGILNQIRDLNIKLISVNSYEE